MASFRSALSSLGLARSLAALAVPALLIARVRGARTGRWSIGERVLGGTLIVLFAATQLLTIRRTVFDPPEWDFYSFWVRAHVAAQGAPDFYDPRAYDELQQRFKFSESFRIEVMEVGFNYPPQTMLLFLPFGHLEPRPAAAAWQLVLVLATIGCIALLARTYAAADGGAGWMLAAALVLMLPATATNFNLAQTNAVTLLLSILYLRDHARPRAGVWLALMPIVKPYLGLLWVWPLLKRQWKVIAVTAAVSLVFAGLAALVFGFDVFQEFLAADVMGRHPTWMFVQDQNQSLQAALARAFHLAADQSTPKRFMLPLAVSALLFVVTVVMCVRARGSAEPWAIVQLLATALLAYPNTLRHYHLMLLAPMFLLWSQRDRVPGGSAATVTIITATWWLCTPYHGDLVFWSFVLWWVIAFGMQVRARSPEPTAAPQASPVLAS